MSARTQQPEEQSKIAVVGGNLTDAAIDSIADFLLAAIKNRRDQHRKKEASSKEPSSFSRN
ncbi:MAG: hypothetical protein VXZ82_03075 [Planctomycetota bacterium]|nr:hypothetical protein [Planctomycetota bacterium]